MTPAQLLDIDVEHARFNALKTLSMTSASTFERRRFGALHATRDASRPDPYYNRILGLSLDAVPELGEAIRWIADSNGGLAVRVELAQDAGGEDVLIERGFRKIDQLLWLQARATAPEPDTSPRELSQSDLPALRSLLEHHGQISDEAWLAKSAHLCTASFRWFGVFDDVRLVSAASMWIHDDAAIFGSALTLPGHRKRGHHNALLQARRAQPPAQQFVDVEPGSISHHNCLRVGFEPIEHRTVWVLNPH